MQVSQSQTVQQTLARPGVHQRWISDYYSDESPFYEAAFDRIAGLLAARGKSTFLDAGCGDAAHALRLARRGYPVVAVDLSDYILEQARKNVAASNLGHLVTVERGSLLDLPAADGAFDFVLCWGVLMHIPKVEQAVAELARVTKPGGFLVISEDNMWSIESTLVRVARRLVGGAFVRRLQGKNPAELNVNARGAEYWRQTESGPLLCRETRIPWLVETLKGHGFALERRMAGAFIERETAVPTKFLRGWLRAFNLAWFRYIRLPQPAMGNLLLFQKAEDPDTAARDPKQMH
jgi:2-polyprenyl-3-methyl-5-hydroxy-6-metoxy-1,4-benzoquinol methylase